MHSSSIDFNREYYESLQPGRRDYWRYMAAPRHRLTTILDLVAASSAHSLIDFGCGNGQLVEAIAERFPRMRLSGADLSQSQVNENARRSPDIEWFVSDLQKPAASMFHGRFEVVVASEIIEHLDEPQAMLRNAASMASAGGTLILTTQSGLIRETERRVGHVRHYDATSIDEMLQSASWTPRRIWNDGFPFHDLSKWWANRNADASMRQFGEKAYGARERLLCALLRLAFRFDSRSRGAQLFAVAEKR